jgi:hypothetical protein
LSAASAILWCALLRETGNGTPKRQGGDRRSKRIEAHAALILSLLEETSDITFMELQAKLASEGRAFGIGTIWCFFNRRRITSENRSTPTRAGLTVIGTPPPHFELTRVIVATMRRYSAR